MKLTKYAKNIKTQLLNHPIFVEKISKNETSASAGEWDLYSQLLDNGTDEQNTQSSNKHEKYKKLTPTPK